MTKVTLNNVGSLIDATTAQTTINNNNTTIQTAFDNTLSRDGTTPNTMSNIIDMNSNQIINLPAPSTVNSPARLIDVTSNPTIVVPGTGTSGHTVPFLDGNNTWSGTNVYSAAETFNGNTTFNGGTNNFVAPLTAASINGGSATNSTVNLRSTTSGAPSGDSISIIATNITAVAPGSTPSTLAVGVPGVKFGALGIAGSTSGYVILESSAVASGVLTCPATTDTIVARATTDTLTNKTISVASNTFNHTPITASLGADVLLNNTTLYFDGPSIAQGSTGTWWVSGTVSVLDTTGAAGFQAKLWDGTTVIASAAITTGGASFVMPLALSGFITNPTGNLRISCKDLNTTTGKILFNNSGNSKDSTISAFRIA